METMTKADVDKIKNGKFEVFNPAWWKERRDPAVAGQGVSRALSEVKKAFVDPEDLEKTSDTHTLLKASHSVKQLIAVVKKARTKCDAIQVWTKKALLAYLSFARKYLEKVSARITSMDQVGAFEEHINALVSLREAVDRRAKVLEERIGRNGLMEAEVAEMRNQLVSVRTKFRSRKKKSEIDFICDSDAYNTALSIRESVPRLRSSLEDYYKRFFLKKYNQLCNIKYEFIGLEQYIKNKKHFNSCLKDIDGLKKKLHGMRDLISHAQNTVAELNEECEEFGKFLEDEETYATVKQPQVPRQQIDNGKIVGDEQTCATVNKLQALARQTHGLASLLRQVVNTEAGILEKYLNNDLDEQIKRTRFYLREKRAEFDNRQEADVLPGMIESTSCVERRLVITEDKLDEYHKNFFVIRHDRLM